MKLNNATFSFVLVVTILILVGLGCGGGSSDACIGTVNYEGKTFQGAGKNEIDAKSFACNNYCVDADPEVEARYRIWVESPKGKAAGSPTKVDSIRKDNGLLDYVTDVCARKCTAQMNPTAKCK